MLLLSPTERQARELFKDKVLRLYNALGRPVASARSKENAAMLELVNGSRIIALPGAEETIRGYSGVALLVIDEASRVPDSLYYAVRPMLAVSQGSLIALTTPFGRRGWFFKEWEGKEDDEEKDDREGKEENEEWNRIAIKAADCPRIKAKFLAKEKAAIGERWFRQEYEISFEDTIAALFSYEDLQAACNNDLQARVLPE